MASKTHGIMLVASKTYEGNARLCLIHLFEELKGMAPLPARRNLEEHPSLEPDPSLPHEVALENPPIRCPILAKTLSIPQKRWEKHELWRPNRGKPRRFNRLQPRPTTSRHGRSIGNVVRLRHGDLVTLYFWHTCPETTLRSHPRAPHLKAVKLKKYGHRSYLAPIF